MRRTGADHYAIADLIRISNGPIGPPEPRRDRQPMRISTWVLLALLTVLAGHYPHFASVAVDMVFGGIAWAVEQPAILATLAAGIVVHRIKSRSVA